MNKDEIYKAGFDAGVIYARIGMKKEKEKKISKSAEYYRRKKARLYAREYYRKQREKETGRPVIPRK